MCCHFIGYAQSNKGTEFWTAWMAHVNGNKSQMSLYITSDVTTDFKVETATGTLIASGTVAANTIYQPVVNIPASEYLGLAEVGPVAKGIHITSTKPIAVYAHIYDQSVSGATLLLPVNALNKDYYSINYTQLSNATVNTPAYSNFAVIATEDNTTVRIVPSAAIISRIGSSVSVTHAVNMAYDILLQKGQVYQGASAEGTDLTGTRIQSVSTGTGGCKKIAVFSGSGKIAIGTPNRTSDNLFQQVYPTASWGKNFVSVPLSGRNYDIFRVVYSDLTANVKVNGVAIAPSQITAAGSIGYYQFETKNSPNATNVITSDKPIQVVQYAVTQDNNGGAGFKEGKGDPEMIYLSPIEQGLNRVTLYSSPYNSISLSFINVVIPTAAAATFTLDGVVYGGANFTVIPGTFYSYAQIPVAQGSHTITAADNFNAIAYGFGQAESYGYAAGTNLRNLNEFVALKGLSATSVQANGCSGVNYNMLLTVPYQPKKIVWDLGDGTTYTDSSPASISKQTETDGTILYTYKYLTAKSYQANTYNATATVTLPVVTSNDCGAERIIDFNFNIADPPEARFNVPASNCAGSPVQFTYNTDAKGSVIQSWLWDFGDGTPQSIEQNPLHTFATGRNYNVTLTTTNVNGCSTTSAIQVVHISRNPTADFKVSAPACPATDVSFFDKSTANEGTITGWLWDFGDTNAAAANNASALQSPVHVYSAPGTYVVTLQVTNSNGCLSPVFAQNVVVPPLPQVSFTLPDACIQNAATFKSTSTLANSTDEGFTYLWNFGDPNASSLNPNTSTLKEPSHRYSEVRGFGNPYKVTLTVTSASGCANTLVQEFVVNGSQPKAVFNIPKEVCGSDVLTIESQSKVIDLGNITRYEICYDYDNKPAQTEVFDKYNMPIPSDGKFTHQYNLMSAVPLAKTYHIHIKIYSGGADCFDVYDQTVTVNARPTVTLNYQTDICQENPAFKITETTDFTGTGVFAGAGIINGNFFDPKKAGAGTHEITYTFTATGTSCVYWQKFAVNVYPKPIITGKRDFTILAGGQVTLNPLAVSLNGTNLIYEWTPALGLSNINVMSPIATPKVTTTYTLNVKSANSCFATAYFNITVLQSPVIYNTFTPNGDGINDTWKIPNLETYPHATVEIFNRSGARVYYAIGYPAPWDGRFNGADLPAGTYYYLIDPKNDRPVLSGSVVIIR
jgi:gliding motility-associated-like protein